jgi:ribonuclease D
MTCQFAYIDAQDALAKLTERLRTVEWVAVDTEADSLHHYYEKVCLIQLTAGDASYIVDPLARMDITPFLDLLSRKKLLMHGAEYDLRMLRATYGFKLDGEVFDTMLAAQLVEGEARSLVALAKAYLGIELTKQKQRSDWSRRPLSDEQLVYACNDTVHLAGIAAHLEGELKRLKRWDWHREACRRMVKATTKDKPPVDPQREWRIKGMSELDRHQLAFVRELWYWREREAQQVDLPPFKVAGNQLLLDLAIWASSARSRSSMARPKLPRNCTGGRLAGLEDAIKRARYMREPEWPPLRVSNGMVAPEHGPDIDRLRADCAAVAQKLGVEASLVASRRQLEAVSLARPTTAKALQEAGGFMDWQTELLLPVVKAIFGKISEK